MEHSNIPLLIILKMSDKHAFSYIFNFTGITSPSPWMCARVFIVEANSLCADPGHVEVICEAVALDIYLTNK